VIHGGDGSPGGIMSVSANGTNEGTAIIWATVNTTANANHGTVAGTLYAFDARNVANDLWDSDMVPGRDTLGSLAKFAPPTVANGKVYVTTFSGQVDVYGLLPLPVLSINVSGKAAVVWWPTNAFITYTLQSSTNLLSGNWLTVTNIPIATTNGCQMTVPLLDSSTATFYRLTW
ncbi:MAG: hypothetical protein ACREE6_04640, partial [Limisphaerales bacterium]